MDLPDPKKLRRLAEMCRKAGIKTYECDGMKITLDDSYMPALSPYKVRKMKAAGIKNPQAAKQFIQGDLAEGGMSSEELLFLSCGGPPEGFDAGDLPS